MSALECAAAREVLHEDLAALLVGAADHAEAQEEAAECVFLVVHDLLLCRDALLRPRHQAEFTDELGISLCRLVGDRAVQPCEGDALIGERVGRFLDVEGVTNEPPLAQKECIQILQCRLGEKAARETDRKAVLIGFCRRFLSRNNFFYRRFRLNRLVCPCVRAGSLVLPVLRMGRISKRVVLYTP